MMQIYDFETFTILHVSCFQSFFSKIASVIPENLSIPQVLGFAFQRDLESHSLRKSLVGELGLGDDRVAVSLSRISTLSVDTRFLIYLVSLYEFIRLFSVASGNSRRQL